MTKDSESDYHIAGTKECAYMGAENIHQLSTILCSGKLQTVKFTDQQT